MPVGKPKTDAQAQLAALCRKLDKAVEAKAEFRRKNMRVFAPYEEMETNVEMLQGQVKALCHEIFLKRKRGQHEAFEGSQFKLVVTAKRERIIDEKRMLADLGATLRELGVVVDEHVVPEGIDRAALDRAVHKKLIDAKVIEPYIREGEAQTPSVSFQKPDTKKEDE